MLTGAASLSGERRQKAAPCDRQREFVIAQGRLEVQETAQNPPSRSVCVSLSQHMARGFPARGRTWRTDRILRDGRVGKHGKHTMIWDNFAQVEPTPAPTCLSGTVFDVA